MVGERKRGTVWFGRFVAVESFAVGQRGLCQPAAHRSSHQQFLARVLAALPAAPRLKALGPEWQGPLAICFKAMARPFGLLTAGAVAVQVSWEFFTPSLVQRPWSPQVVKVSGQSSLLGS